MKPIALTLMLVVGLPLSLAADTLILRNGTRIEGELVGVRGSVIDFEERRSFGGSRRISVNRDEVQRIDFESYRPAPGFGGGGRPPGMRERQVIVSADVSWNDANIEVRSGQTIYFEAIGQVRWGRDRRDGPEGERNSPSNPGRPIPNRPAAALIGKVGNTSTDYFFIGAEQGAIRIRSNGRLYLGINDDYINDNTGNFKVTVYY
jgi:hypothetical protein